MNHFGFKDIQNKARFCLAFRHLNFFLFPIRLKQQVQDKEKLEMELYRRFVMVMNEKKAKIRSLQDAVHQLSHSDEDGRRDEGIQRSNFESSKPVLNDRKRTMVIKLIKIEKKIKFKQRNKSKSHKVLMKT